MGFGGLSHKSYSKEKGQTLSDLPSKIQQHRNIQLLIVKVGFKSLSILASVIGFHRLVRLCRVH